MCTAFCLGPYWQSMILSVEEMNGNRVSVVQHQRPDHNPDSEGENGLVKERQSASLQAETGCILCSSKAANRLVMASVG